MKRVHVPLLALSPMLSLPAAEPPVPLYSPQEGAARTLTDDGWFPVSSLLFNQHYFYVPWEEATRFDSFPVEETGAWTTIGLFTGDVLHPDSPVLDSADGFTLRFDLAIDEENHEAAIDIDEDGLADEAGFTVMILDREAVGIAINFWEDRIWASSNEYVSDSDPLAQAEGVAQAPAAMATLRDYALTIKNGVYQLRIGATPVLEGPTRDYDFFSLTLNPFNKPNIINIGDASFRAGARARIGAITIETCYDPSAPAALTVAHESGGLRLAWESVPGSRYVVQAGPDLEQWDEVTSFVADTFATTFFEPISDVTPSRFYRVLKAAP